MKVLFELPYAQYGGTEKHVFTLIRALGENIEPCLITPYGRFVPAFRELGVPYEIIPELAFRPGLGNTLRLHHQAFHKLYQKFGFSLVHVHAGIEYAVAAHFASRKLPDIPMVFTVHGYPDAASYLTGGILANRLVDHVICVSEAERRKALRYGWSKAKLSVIYNGVSMPEVPDTPEKTRAYWSIPESAYVIGTVARLDRRKGIHYLISAMPKVISRFHNTILVIVGDGSMRDELSSLSRKLGISQNVVFTGELPDPSPILSILDVFVLPSLTEALGIAILEAMAFSLPVVASNVGGIPEAVDNDRTGILVPPGNPDALGEALIRFAANPRMRESYGSAGRERFLKLFTDSAMADQTLEVYKRVLAKSQGW
ncbi:MAG: glycosyltransferase family 4 protein [Bacillota bacterium]